ncbi:hypothetical protein EWM64_g2601 [Hericium alpestre]|uniref:Uncharacterized protein n=1 Tax=Hericium alpestre TaxID=135208 RepID=A0A4Z0A2Y7_9AGAM|nr:hypothetical protein EWM64_g2601 [Hericium alpestre]
MKVNATDASMNYKVTNRAYTARHLDALSPAQWEHFELDARGFKYFAWCGSIAYVILDNKDCIIAVLVPPLLEDDHCPDEEHWMSTMEHVGELFESKHEAAGGLSQQNRHPGEFTVLATGVLYDGGQKRPGNLAHSKWHQDLLCDLTDDADVSRIANFQSDALSSYFPKVYAHMYDSLGKLSRSQQELCHNFRGGSVYPTCTFNLGPNTVCLDHNDCNNAPDVSCTITVLRTFNADTGSELYLWDLALIVRFLPGTTILLSSASMRHGNLPTQLGEQCYSMTQYCPGGLLRWVRHGLRPASLLSKTKRAAIDEDHKAWWAEVLGWLSKYDKLEADREWLVRWEHGKA